VLNLRSADASSEAIQPIVSDLEALGRDIDSTSEALAEADRLVAEPPARPAAQA
jgi:hypothetical protein